MTPGWPELRRIATLATLLAGALPPAVASAADELLANNLGPGMRVVDTANTNLEPAIPDARFGHWSSDGARIIASVGQDVVVMDADGSNRRVVASGWSSPVFSPDGRRWAGWRVASGAIQFGVGSLAGGPVTPVPNLPHVYMTVTGQQLAWSSQNEIAFAYYPDENDPDTRAVGVIRPDGSGFRSLLTMSAPPKPQVDDVTYDEPVEIAFSPDGKTLAVGRHISYGRIGTRDDPFQFEYLITTLAVQPGGVATERVVGTGENSVVTGVKPLGLSFAPDGNRVAVVGDDGDNTKVAIYAVDTGSLAPIAARSFLKVRWRPNVTDTDGDGLLDTWETAGIDADGNGSIDVDLPAMGADSQHKDIFVELDYMPPHRLDQAGIDSVVAAFANAPVANPDGVDGVTLHVDNGPTSVMDPTTGALWGARSDQDSISHQDLLGTVLALGYDWTDFDTLKNANFADARKPAFHYAISAHGFDGDVSGIARDLPSSDFLVTLGSGCTIVRGSDCTFDARQQAGTFMHELGHNLGLRHGGDDDATYKPSHLSVMNYAFQLTGLVHADKTTELDYSRHGFAMNEAALNEGTGFAFPASSPQANFLTIVQCATAADARNGVWPLVSFAVDFNCDGATGNIVSSDTNDDGVVTAFTAYAEWPTLIYRGGQVGDLGAQPLPGTTAITEPDVAELLATQQAFEAYVPGGGGPDGGNPGGGPGSGGPGPGGQPDGGNIPPAPPELTGLAIRPRAFVAMPRGGSIARRGTTVRYRLSSAAAVRLKVERLVNGRRRGRNCVPPAHAPRGRACLRAQRVRGGFSHAGRAGSNSFAFTGRLAGRALRPGRYQLTATPVSASGASGTPKRAAFRVLSPRSR